MLMVIHVMIVQMEHLTPQMMAMTMMETVSVMQVIVMITMMAVKNVGITALNPLISKL